MNRKSMRAAEAAARRQSKNQKNGADVTRFDLNTGIASLTLHQSPGGRSIISVAGISQEFADAHPDPKERLRILRDMILDGCSFIDQVIENMSEEAVGGSEIKNGTYQLT